MITIDPIKKKAIDDAKRASELKQLLSDSDWRMTLDKFPTMTQAEQEKWTADRESWREELRSITN